MAICMMGDGFSAQRQGKICQFLRDNRSEVNLVRKGFIDKDVVQKLENLLELKGISGHALAGGDHQVKLGIRLLK